MTPNYKYMFSKTILEMCKLKTLQKKYRWSFCVSVESDRPICVELHQRLLRDDKEFDGGVRKERNDLIK